MGDCGARERARCAQSALDACLLLEKCREGVLCLDSSGIVKYANPMAHHLLASPADGLIGRRIDAILGRGAVNHRLPPLSGRSRSPFPSGDAAPGLIDTFIAGSGTPIEYRLVPVAVDGRSHGFVMTCHDIGERCGMEARPTYLARHDPLSELPNRRLVSDRLDYEICRARRYGESFALHLVDLDDFKGVNDRFGHPTGDKLLVRLADRLRAAVRESDTVARIGGDEFAIIQVAVDSPDDAVALARKLLDEVQKPFYLEACELFPGATIGVSVFSGDQSEDLLWRRADAALCKAKARGKNTFVVDDGITGNLQADSQLVAALKRALEERQFELVYQPQFSANGGAIVGVEALLRWRHPVFGEVGPATFIPEAEAHGLIEAIGLWVAGEVCRQARVWMDAGIPFGRIAFNVSPRQLASAEHFAALVAVVDDAGIPWSTLEIELTEAAYSGAAREVIAVLVSLQRRGARIAIDDFGSACSSLPVLCRMKADTIKIAPAFFRDIDDAESADAVRETIALAHALGMTAVAEGVEMPSQMAFLVRLGCDRSQGFHLARPDIAQGLEHCFFDLQKAGAEPDGASSEAVAEDTVAGGIPWSDTYATGIAQIDLQHQKLVDLINCMLRTARMPSCGGQYPGGLLDEIARFTDYHFRCEEAFMAHHRVVCHHIDHHRAMHAAGMKMLRAWIAAFHEGRLGLGELCSDLAGWLVGHILAEDKTLGEQIVAIHRGTAPDEAYRATMLSAALEAR